MQQCDLLRCQARWQEFLSQYDFDIVCIHGKENTLSCLIYNDVGANRSLGDIIVPVFTIGTDESLLAYVKRDYLEDEWCKKLRENIMSMLEGTLVDILMYWKG